MAYDDDFNFDLDLQGNEVDDSAPSGGWGHHRTWGERATGSNKARSFDPRRLQVRLGDTLPSGWGSAAHPYTEFSGSVTPSGINTYQGSTQSDVRGGFRENWYKPMFEAYNRAPIAGIMGADYKGAGENLVTPEQSQFVEASGVLESAQLNAQDLLSGYGTPNTAGKLGYEGPVIMKEGQHDLISAGQDLDIANVEYGREQDRIDLAEEEAANLKKEAFKDARIARQEALSGRAPEYERARAGVASTGMSYSAPAERNLEAVQEEGVSDLAGISRQKADAVKDFKDNMAGLATERSDAEEDMELARRTFATDFAGLMQDSATAGDELILQARTLGDKWGEYGSSTMGHDGSLGLRTKHGEVPYGSKRGGGGIGGSTGYFQEDMSVVPELGMLTSLVQEADTFAQQLSDQFMSEDWLGSTGSEGDV